MSDASVHTYRDDWALIMDECNQLVIVDIVDTRVRIPLDVMLSLFWCFIQDVLSYHQCFLLMGYFFQTMHDTARLKSHQFCYAVKKYEWKMKFHALLVSTQANCAILTPHGQVTQWKYTSSFTIHNYNRKILNQVHTIAFSDLISAAWQKRHLHKQRDRNLSPPT